MKSIIILMIIIITMPVSAANNISSEQRTSLKKLYHQINSAEAPYSNEKISNEVSRLVNGSCFRSAFRSLKRKKHISLAKTNMMTEVMRSTCKCVSTSKAMIDGVIRAAIFFKKYGKHSSLAKNSMRNGMSEAKQNCFSKMRQQMQSLRN